LLELTLGATFHVQILLVCTNVRCIRAEVAAFECGSAPEQPSASAQLTSGETGSETVRESVEKGAAQFEQMSAHDEETLQRMINYAQTGRCRWARDSRLLRRTPHMEHCGVCDTV
jgi:superfamily II DNA helicase RecQ